MATGTYDDTLADPISQLRFVIGDTKDPFYFSDNELQALLDRADDSVYGAALFACQAGMARERSSASSRSIGPMSISNDSYQRWNDLYDMLVSNGPTGSGGAVGAGLRAMPYASGYQPKDARPVTPGRPLHARVGIHDDGGEDSDYQYGTDGTQGYRTGTGNP